MRAGLDRARVVEEAARLADAAGLDALTLGAVAAALGVKTPSLYVHVEGLEGLTRELRLLGAQRLAVAFTRAAVGKSGDDAVRAVAAAYREFARRHPGLYAAAMLRAAPRSDREAARASDEVMQIVGGVLSGYGLDGPALVHAARTLRAALHGFVSLEAAGGFGLPVQIDESWAELVETLIAGLRARARRGRVR